jgi:hypothetical protein
MNGLEDWLKYLGKRCECRRELIGIGAVFLRSEGRGRRNFILDGTESLGDTMPVICRSEEPRHIGFLAKSMWLLPLWTWRGPNSKGSANLPRRLPLNIKGLT